MREGSPFFKMVLESEEPLCEEEQKRGVPDHLNSKVIYSKVKLFLCIVKLYCIVKFHITKEITVPRRNTRILFLIYLRIPVLWGNGILSRQ